MLVSAIAKTVFRLNGQLVEMAEVLAAPAGLTASWWRVLGAVAFEPAPVVEIARRFGITRQSVQRVADLVVAEGLAEYRPNPAHQRAKLVCLTEAGRAKLREIAPGHRARSAQLVRNVGDDPLREILAGLTALSRGIDEAAGDAGHLDAP
ncbi:MarR family winged helix-turn-helix transcriptional regulator [Salsipaludibacter albus]|uniref:MarR family winged helix-turn-helix transcriptional regulator n=1 Tax=Salsipaludibacter albus TaxID=2849650 RepID=UPI001EE4A6AD